MVATDPQRAVVTAQFRIKIDGAEMSAELDRSVDEVVVDERLHLPTMFEIRFNNPQLRWNEGDVLGEGKEVEILAGTASTEKSLCIGKITAIDVDLDDIAPTLTVRGYDLAFALHRNVKSRSYLQMSDSDIAQKVIAEGGMTAKVDTTSHVYDYIFQHNQTNYAFLLSRARRIGYELRVDGRTCCFRKPQPQGAPIDLEWRVNLKRFRPHLSVAEQVDEVEVRGWDIMAKQEIIATATTGEGTPEIGESRKGGAVANGVWGQAKRIVTDLPVDSQGEADAIAKARLEDMLLNFITAEGECRGDPKLRVGALINVKAVGNRYGGKYYLTGVTHKFTKDKGHEAGFTASTRNPFTISSILHEQPQPPPVQGVVIGIVTNNKDPEEMGRVKVKFPWLHDEEESWWARLVPPMAGHERGFLTIPEVNDEVLVAFEHGDPRRPFVVGALWNGQDKIPPVPQSVPMVDGASLSLPQEFVGNDGRVNVRVWRSRTGHLFVFDDTDSSESISIIDKTGKNHIVITSSDNKLDVYLEGDIGIESKTGQIKVLAEKDITFESRQGKIALTAQQDVSAESKTGKMTLTAQQDVSAESKAGAMALSALRDVGLESKSSNFTAKGAIAAELSGNVSAKVSGATAELQGQAMASVKAAIVNIN